MTDNHVSDHTDDPAAQHAWERSVTARDAPAARPGVTFTTEEDVVIVVHPGFDTLDAIGPHYFLASMLGATVHVATTGATRTAAISAGGLAVMPTTALDDAPPAPTVLLVPGGDTGVLLADAAAMSAIRRSGHGCERVHRSGRAWRTGTARRRRATSHWSVRHLLSGYGATPVDERVVEDGNVMTAAGATSGMDLALRLVGRLRDDDARFL
ncbi:DJ-1/PfpI family protein [Rhodococcus sp. NPDC058521]|uniref:DJ-1/PfpI family protein n=1 Tax=Rhodococcus sp. NPDC058521 TaxID=3346536 RepID=UPI0036672133